MAAAILTLVEGVLYPDVRSDLTLSSLQAHKPCDLECMVDEDLERVTCALSQLDR